MMAMMFWRARLTEQKNRLQRREKVGCPISNADMAELNSSKSVVILVAKIHKHKKDIKKNEMNGCVMPLALVLRSTRREKHLIVSFKRQREWKRSRGLKRLRGRRREHALGKKSDKKSSREKNPNMMTGRRAKKMANAVEVDLQAVAVVAVALEHTVLPRVGALEVIVLAHRIRRLHSLPRHIHATVAVEGGVDLVAHEGGGEEVTAPALVAVVWHLAHLPFLLVLAHGHVLIAEIKSGSLGEIKANHLLRNKSVAKVLGSHLPPCPNHQKGVEVKNMSNTIIIQGEEQGSENLHRLVVVHREEDDLTQAVGAAAEEVVEAGVHRRSHQNPMSAEVKARKGGIEQNERGHDLHLILLTVGAGAEVKATIVAVN